MSDLELNLMSWMYSRPLLLLLWTALRVPLMQFTILIFFLGACAWWERRGVRSTATARQITGRLLAIVTTAFTAVSLGITILLLAAIDWTLAPGEREIILVGANAGLFVTIAILVDVTLLVVGIGAYLNLPTSERSGIFSVPPPGRRLRASAAAFISLFAILLLRHFQLDKVTGGAETFNHATFLWVAWTIFLVPLSEEFVFRGILLRKFSTIVPTSIAVTLQAFLFSSLHLDVHRAFELFAIGMLLGWTTRISRSFLPAVAVHFALNATALLR
jgi:membrane protease YdiL (CAAX protease family)